MNNYFFNSPKFTKILIFVIIVNLLIFFKKTFAENIELIPKSYLILPEHTNIKIKWISKPLDQKLDYDSNNIQFVANDDKMLILYSGNIIQNLITGGLVKLNKSIKRFYFLSDGALIFFDGENLLYGKLTANTKSKIPEVSLHPIVNIPGKNTDLFIGGKGELFAYAYNESNSNYEIFRFIKDKKKFEKVAILKEKIDCLTGSDKKIYVLNGKQIKELIKNDLHLFYEHPREEILEIYYKENIGIFYRTKHGVGFIKDGYGIEFLQLEEPLFYFDENKMYVFMPKNLGVFLMENIDDLKNYNFKIDKLIGIERNF